MSIPSPRPQENFGEIDTKWFSVAALALLLMGANGGAGGSREETAEGVILLQPAPGARCRRLARSQAQDWLKGVGKTDAACTKAFEHMWSGDRPLLDKVAATLTLGDPAAAQLLKEARDPETARSHQRAQSHQGPETARLLPR